MEKLKLNYYYGSEAEQFYFYRIPKALFTNELFKKISCEAKVLYGLMLDRMGLSVKNQWFDAENRVYIIFTLQDAIKHLHCGKDKVVALFKELEENAGLIERKRQGQGRPAITYVKNFIKTTIPITPPQEADDCDDEPTNKKTSFDYYYGSEAEKFNFYRIPKTLFTDENFKRISCEAKVLYGLMIDRMGLSVKNQWIDAEDKVYIIFTLQDAIEYLNFGKDKCVNLFKELEEVAGLIERKKQGQGRPAIIYIKNFIKQDSSSLPDISNHPVGNSGDNLECSVKNSVDKLTEGDEQSDNAAISAQQKADHKGICSDFGKSEVKTSAMSEVKTSENQKSRIRLFRSQDFGKNAPNDTNINNNDFNDIENQSINRQYPLFRHDGTNKNKEIDGIERYDTYRKILEDNLEYYHMADTYGKERMDETIEILLDAICSTRPYLRINQSDVPTEAVRSRFLKLDCFHLEYAFDELDKNTTKIFNIRSYLLTTFYNAPATINQHYKSLVNHDLYGKGKDDTKE